MNRIFTVAVVLIGAALVVWVALRDGGAGAGAVPKPAGQTPVAAPATPAAADTNAAIDACIAGSKVVAERRASRGAPAAAGEPSDSAVVARACAPLFHEAACREAHLHFDDPPADVRSQTVLDACKRDYCDKLAAPKPRACDPSQPPPEDGLATFQTWDELRHAIWKRDLGEAGVARLEAGLGR
jgi:hypothetical protein